MSRYRNKYASIAMAFGGVNFRNPATFQRLAATTGRDKVHGFNLADEVDPRGNAGPCQRRWCSSFPKSILVPASCLLCRPF